MIPIKAILLLVWFATSVIAFNGELVELECPDECDCHYFRVNWVTDCSDSNFSKIPYEDISPNVYILDLNDNTISEMEPFPGEMKMRRLQVADNLLTELKKESFVGLNYLIDADFSNNKIRRVDPDTFNDSPGFITLDLQGNPLEPVDGPFLSIKSLLYLDISNCGLKNINPQFFTNVTSLSTLDLSGNPLMTLNNSAFESLTSLETLKLNNCNISYISDEMFESLSDLKSLELRENNLVGTEWALVLDSLVRLEHLDLRHSGINHLPDTVFNNNTYLRTLVLSENALVDFDVATTLGYLQQLDTLDLSYCNLTLPFTEDTFSNATKIKSLYLSGNSLFASDLLVALAPLHDLQKLSLSNCGLSKLPDTFHKFKSLKELDISHNPLNDAFVKLLSPLETLEYLNMGYSNLSYISPHSFSKMTSMRRLILAGNDLNNLEMGLFGNLTQLESLDLNSCGLRRPLNATLFFNNLTYTDLTELTLAGNPLRVSRWGPLLPKQFSRLQNLDLSNCNLTFLPKEAFTWTQNITTLVLLGNHFSEPSELTFLGLLPKLQTLDLRYNNLTTFPPAVIEANPLISKLKLIGNPFRCECFVAELWDWANLEHNDLSILEGSTVTAENIKTAKSKGKKLLVCNYSPEKIPLSFVMNKTAHGRRSFKNPQRYLTTTNRTWAKYVRESGCEQKVNLEPISRVPRAAKMSTGSNLVPNNWAMAAMNALIVYAALMVTLGAVFVFTKNRRMVVRTAHKD